MSFLTDLVVIFRPGDCHPVNHVRNLLPYRGQTRCRKTNNIHTLLGQLRDKRDTTTPSAHRRGATHTQTQHTDEKGPPPSPGLSHDVTSGCAIPDTSPSFGFSAPFPDLR